MVSKNNQLMQCRFYINLKVFQSLYHGQSFFLYCGIVHLVFVKHFRDETYRIVQSTFSSSSHISGIHSHSVVWCCHNGIRGVAYLRRLNDYSHSSDHWNFDSFFSSYRGEVSTEATVITSHTEKPANVTTAGRCRILADA